MDTYTSTADFTYVENKTQFAPAAIHFDNLHRYAQSNALHTFSLYPDNIHLRSHATYYDYSDAST